MEKKRTVRAEKNILYVSISIGSILLTFSRCVLKFNALIYIYIIICSVISLFFIRYTTMPVLYSGSKEGQVSLSVFHHPNVRHDDSVCVLLVMLKGSLRPGFAQTAYVM